MLSLLIKRLKGKTPRDVIRFVRRKVLAILTRGAIQKRVDDPRIEIVHVMFNDKFNKPYVDFLNRNFDTKKHLVLCLRVNDSVATPFPVGDNVVEIYDIRKIDLSAPHIKKLICHSLFDSMLVDKLYDEPDLLKKSCWMVWGGDLYEAPRDEKNDFVRRNFGVYAAGFDASILSEKYGVDPAIISELFYFFMPVTKEMLDRTPHGPSGKLRIQINNSSDKSTLDVLDDLQKFKNEDIVITTVLSYGDLSCKDDIIKKGKLIFGDKFEYLEAMLTPKAYLEYLGGNDIIILNQDRQQGGGNVMMMLYFGKKVFVRKNVTMGIFLKNKGVDIFNTDDIKRANFMELSEKCDSSANKDIASSYFSDEWKITLMKDIFNNG